MIHAYSGYQQRFGEVFRARLVMRPVYIATGPEYATHILQKNQRNFRKDTPTQMVGQVIGNGILTSEGDFWRKQRRLVQPAFHKAQIANLSTLMAEETNKVLENMERYEEVEVHSLMTKLALQVVSRALYGQGISDDNIRLVDECVTVLLELMVMKIRYPFRVLKYRLTGKIDEYWAKKRQLDDLIYGIVDQRKEEGVGDNDLLDMLLGSVDAETGEPLRREEMLDELMALFIAGHETSANGLSWLMLLLDQHPAVVEGLREEVDKVLGTEQVSFQELKNLNYPDRSSMRH